MNTLTPAQRLRASRQAIVVHLARGSRNRPREGATADANSGGHEHHDRPRASNGTGWWRVAQHALGAWWRGHPAYSAAMVARPVLEGFAREKPVQVIAAAAALGAAVVVLKPWRLVSAGALLAATLKSTDITRLVMSMMASAMPSEEQATNEEDPR